MLGLQLLQAATIEEAHVVATVAFRAIERSLRGDGGADDGPTAVDAMREVVAELLARPGAPKSLTDFEVVKLIVASELLIGASAGPAGNGWQELARRNPDSWRAFLRAAADFPEAGRLVADARQAAAVVSAVGEMTGVADQRPTTDFVTAAMRTNSFLAAGVPPAWRRFVAAITPGPYLVYDGADRPGLHLLLSASAEFSEVAAEALAAHGPLEPALLPHVREAFGQRPGTRWTFGTGESALTIGVLDGPALWSFHHYRPRGNPAQNAVVPGQDAKDALDSCDRRHRPVMMHPLRDSGRAPTGRVVADRGRARKG